MKFTTFQWIVIGFLAIMTLTMIGTVSVLLLRDDLHQARQTQPTIDVSESMKTLVIPLPPTWTPEVRPSPTKQISPTIFPTNTSDPLCDEIAALNYLYEVDEIISDITAERLAVMSVGGYISVLSNTESTIYLGSIASEHYETALNFSPPPCMEEMHSYFVEYLYCRYYMFYHASRKEYVQAQDWLAKSDTAVDLMEANNPFK